MGSSRFFSAVSHYSKTGSTATKYYTFNGQKVALRTGSTLYYLYNDHLNTASLTTCGTSTGCGGVASGGVVHQIRNYPYGETRWQSGADVSDFGFTDQRDESMGLMDFDARYYDSAIGRFLSADSVVPDFANPQDLNRYSYVINNPLKFTDPDGRPCIDRLLVNQNEAFRRKSG